MKDIIDKQNERRINLAQVANHLSFAIEILERLIKEEGGEQE